MNGCNRLAVVAAVNDDAVLAANLKASPSIASGDVTLHVERGHRSAGAAYNEGFARTTAELVVFAHQDVYLPSGWERSIESAARGLGGDWAVLGVFGITAGRQYVGRVWSSGLGREAVGALKSSPVVSADELVLVVRRASGIVFDPALPGFHLYGTDVVQTAIAAGLGAHVVHAPVIHNSRPVRRLDERYIAAYRYMQAKWRERLPIPTCVVPLTPTQWPIWRSRLVDARRRITRRQKRGCRVSDPSALARELGYEDAA